MGSQAEGEQQSVRREGEEEGKEKREKTTWPVNSHQKEGNSKGIFNKTREDHLNNQKGKGKPKRREVKDQEGGMMKNDKDFFWRSKTKRSASFFYINYDF